MRLIDFLFWHYYCYFEQNKKKYKGNRVQVAEGMVIITTSLAIGILISIVKNKYELFRTRWGSPDNVSKKNLKILLWYTLITTIGMLLVAIVIGTLNKHGYFEGCRLFP